MWILFAVLAVIITVAGPHISRNGSIIAEKTGLTGGWIGIALVATVTSLPELATGVSAITVWDTPDIAVGDLFGSCVFNLAILMVVDFMLRGAPVYSRANVGHIISGGFGIVLIGFAGISLLVARDGFTLPVFHVGLPSLILLALYFAAIRVVFTYERSHREQFAEEVTRLHPEVSLREAAVRYGVAALFIVIAGSLLPFAGSGLADAMGWSRSFVGTLLVAAATSLPELVVTVAAVRLGALNLAVAGLLGSNMFNMAILAIDDMLYTKGPLFAATSPSHAVSAMSAAVMTGLFIVALQYRPANRAFRRAGWFSIALFIIYLLNSYVIFLHGH